MSVFSPRLWLLDLHGSSSLIIEKPLQGPQTISLHFLNIFKRTEKLCCSSISLQGLKNLMRLSLTPYRAILVRMETSSRLLLSWAQTKSQAKVCCSQICTHFWRCYHGLSFRTRAQRSLAPANILFSCHISNLLPLT